MPCCTISLASYQGVVLIEQWIPYDVQIISLFTVLNSRDCFEWLRSFEQLLIHRERSENLYGYYEQQLNPSENDQLGFTADEMGAFWRASHRSEQFDLDPGPRPPMVAASDGGVLRRRGGVARFIIEYRGQRGGGGLTI